MGCATGVVKNLVFLFNFLCSIVGITLIAAGTLIFLTVNKVDSATKQNNSVVPSFIIALGVLIFIISFLGCCGVCQKNQCMLVTYAVILLLFFIIQLSLGIYGYISISGDEKEPRTRFRNDLENTFKHYREDENIKQFFDGFQSELKCCGVNGPTDYFTIYPTVLPGSCCGSKAETCKVEDAYQKGCSDKIYDIIARSLKVISYIALGICVTEIVAALFAICLVNSYRNESRRGL